MVLLACERTHRRVACLALLASLACAACDIARPGGAYRPLPLEEPVPEPDGSARTVEDSGVPGLPTFEGGPFGEGGGPSEDGETPTNPLAALQGDYMVRFEGETEIQDGTLGRIVTSTQSFGVMRVVLQDGGLVSTEWLCSSNSQQTAEKGTVQTSLADIWNDLTPVTTNLDVDLDAGTWSSTSGTRRQGWTSTAAKLPTDPTKTPDDYLDPENDGYGVTVTVSARVSALGLPVASTTCKFDVASYSTSRYVQGKLDGDGLLSSAKVRLEDADAHAWRARLVSGSVECDISQINDQTIPQPTRNEIMLARLPQPLQPTDQDPRPCPSQSTFDAALL